MEGLKTGRIVYFVFGEGAASEVNGRRLQSDYGTAKWPHGAQPCIGRPVTPGDVQPAMVVRVHDGAIGEVNLKVFLDGTDDYWATDVKFSEVGGGHTWHWMFEGQNTRYNPSKGQA